MTASQSSMSGGGEPGMRTVVWFRRDLRVEDNPALSAAARTGGEVVPAYVWSPEEDGPYYPGRVSRWWLSQSHASLRQFGAGHLVSRHPPLQRRRRRSRCSTWSAAPAPRSCSSTTSTVRALSLWRPRRSGCCYAFATRCCSCSWLFAA